MRPGHHEERVGPRTEHRNSIHAPHNPKLARNSGARTFCNAPKRCNSNDAISKLEIRVGELRATFLRNHSSVPHSGVVLPNRCNACGALLPRLFLLSGGGIATIGLRHAGDTPSRVFYGSKTPRWALGGALGCRCCAQRAVHLGRMCRKRGVWGEVDDVLSVGSRCWGRVVGPRQCGRLRQRGRPGWRRRCEGWLGQGRIDAGYKKAGPRRVPPLMTPFPPLGGAEIAVRGGVAAKLQTHWVKTVKNRPFWRNGSTLWRIWYQSWCVVRT